MQRVRGSQHDFRCLNRAARGSASDRLHEHATAHIFQVVSARAGQDRGAKGFVVVAGGDEAEGVWAQIYAWRKGIKTIYYIRLRQMALEGTELDTCVSCTL